MEPRPEEEPPIESAPEGSVCAEHADRPALVICPRCGSYACLACWHGSVRRCHGCVVRTPGPLVPWEDPARNLLARYFGTLADAASPLLTAPSFRHPGVARAVVFFLLTFVPLAIASGIVPFTARVLFGASFSVELVGSPSPEEVWLDVLRAGGLGLGVRFVQWLALAVPFVSLSKAYADRGHPDAPLRAMLYRGWLLPGFELTLQLAGLSLSRSPSSVASLATQFVGLIPLVLLLSSMRAASRVGSGVGPLTALLTIGVPFALMIGAQFFLMRGVLFLVPELGEIAEQARRVSEDAARAPAPEPSAPAPPPRGDGPI
ncbi:MAG: hypothetical protein OHK0013_19560 [Sandaracinaceae bacterium]